jgi:uncharacterized protein YebE (UPF0316 family)
MLRTFSFLKFDPTSLKRNLFWPGLATMGVFFMVFSTFDIEGMTTALRALIQHLPLQSLGGALVIFGLRLTDVPIGTLKTVLMVRGMRTWATLLGLLEVTIWITAMGRVMGQLDNPWNVAGYALGYSVGTWLGMWLESRLAFGSVELHTISVTKSAEVTDAIRSHGYGVTEFQGLGHSGPVTIVGTVAERKHLEHLLKHIREVDASAFVTVDETRQVMGGQRPSR